MLSRVLSLLVILPFFVACSSIQLVRLRGPEPINGAPEIVRLVDLGSLPLADIGIIDSGHSDGRFTPGEWIAVVGSNLAHQPTIKIGSRNIKVQGYLKGGSLLILI